MNFSCKQILPKTRCVKKNKSRITYPQTHFQQLEYYLRYPAPDTLTLGELRSPRPPLTLGGLRPPRPACGCYHNQMVAIATRWLSIVLLLDEFGLWIRWFWHSWVAHVTWICVIWFKLGSVFSSDTVTVTVQLGKSWHTDAWAIGRYWPSGS